MRRIPKQSKLWKYLDSTGVLNTGDEALILEAKKTYWRQYDQERKQKSRKMQHREIVVAFPAEEINHVRSMAKAKGNKIQEYIRACVKADMSHEAVIPHRALVVEILQVMQQCYNQLDAIKKKDTKGWLVISRTYENVETVLQQTEKNILNLVKQPQNLKQVITEAIQRNPNTQELLKSILKTNDYKINDKENGIIPPTP